MAKVTNKEIREYFGHNGLECRVRISRDGEITRYGSPNAFDRSKDYWQDLGLVEDAIKEMENSRV